MPTIDVNGTALYYETRGTGPPVLLIMGATGDGGHFDALADLLADEFTVISYDRRGNGRSSRRTTALPRAQQSLRTSSARCQQRDYGLS
ncbi:alpha/beta fold hydrolase [Saccharopolyspora flava]|uniref:alpha/beta fold hydrolase n=1 Tax=Saccharopolyspora flava TaxID=95161 RepID=UPI001114D14F|nr:alpha/beta hydrolase [Saccharopolyspora flava]